MFEVKLTSVIENEAAKIKLTSFLYDDQAYVRFIIKIKEHSAVDQITHNVKFPSLEQSDDFVAKACNESIEQLLSEYAHERDFGVQLINALSKPRRSKPVFGQKIREESRANPKEAIKRHC